MLNIIVGKYKDQNYNIEFGYNVKYAFFEQDQVTSLNPENSIFDQIRQDCPESSDQEIRQFLGSFFFPGDDAFKKIKFLSGGERNRVGMVKVLLTKI